MKKYIYSSTIIPPKLHLLVSLDSNNSFFNEISTSNEAKILTKFYAKALKNKRRKKKLGRDEKLK